VVKVPDLQQFMRGNGKTAVDVSRVHEIDVRSAQAKP
jgi:hypothetical protein